LFDELKTQVSNRRRLIHPSSGLFEENNFDDDDSKSPTSTLQGGQLKYKYKARDRKSVKERALNWLSLGDWLISKRDLGEGILNCRYRKNFHMITGWPKTELSPVLALIISSLISKQYPNSSQLAELNQSEIQFLQKLIQRTRIDCITSPI